MTSEPICRPCAAGVLCVRHSTDEAFDAARVRQAHTIGRHVLGDFAPTTQTYRCLKCRLIVPALAGSIPSPCPGPAAQS